VAETGGKIELLADQQVTNYYSYNQQVNTAEEDNKDAETDYLG
jgi:hypothetical protein